MQDDALNWDDIDTVLLDVDGTLLDLHYDNVVWNQQLPLLYAVHNGLSLDASQQYLFGRMRELRGQIEFYCMDYWADFTGLDVVALHRTYKHLIRYRADTDAFLTWIDADKTLRSLIVTNAHQDSIAVKQTQTAFLNRVDGSVSSHEYGAPKEHSDFWEQLCEQHAVEPTRSVLFDDNVDVLDAALKFGVTQVRQVTTPNTRQGARPRSTHPTLDRFAEIAPLSSTPSINNRSAETGIARR